MKNERLETALAWCKKYNVGSNRLKKFNREAKKKRFKMDQNKGKTIARPKNLLNY